MVYTGLGCGKNTQALQGMSHASVLALCTGSYIPGFALAVACRAAASGPNNGLELTAYSVRCAPAFGSSSDLAFGFLR